MAIQKRLKKLISIERNIQHQYGLGTIVSSSHNFDTSHPIVHFWVKQLKKFDKFLDLATWQKDFRKTKFNYLGRYQHKNNCELLQMYYIFTTNSAYLGRISSVNPAPKNE